MLSRASTAAGGNTDSPLRRRSVMMLRPKPGLMLDGGTSIATAALKMQESNTDAVLVVDPATGLLAGIMTDTDVTRRVLAMLGFSVGLVVVMSAVLAVLFL